MPHAVRLLTVLIGLAAAFHAGATPRSATINLSPDGSLLAAVNNDSRSVTFFALPDQRRLAEVLVGRDPQTVAITADGRRAFVTNRRDDTVSVIDLDTMTHIQEWPVPDEPVGIVVTRSGRMLLSAQGADQMVELDADSGAVMATLATPPTPRGMALAPNEGELYVSHFATGKLSVIDLAAWEVVAVVSTGVDSNLASGLVVSPDGARAWLPHSRSNSGNIALLFDTTLFPVVSAVDLASRLHRRSDRISLDTADRPVNMPLDALLLGDTTLYVLNSGSNEIFR